MSDEKNRDEDLDALEEELRRAEAAPNPHIERPEHLDIRNGMLCWLDGTRVCGSDCIAFNVEELDEHGVPNQGPNRCLPLVYMGQQGSAALSTVVLNRKRIVEIQDRKREQQLKDVPDPFGGRKL